MTIYCDRDRCNYRVDVILINGTWKFSPSKRINQFSSVVTATTEEPYLYQRTRSSSSSYDDILICYVCVHSCVPMKSLIWAVGGWATWTIHFSKGLPFEQQTDWRQSFWSVIIYVKYYSVHYTRIMIWSIA